MYEVHNLGFVGCMLWVRNLSYVRWCSGSVEFNRVLSTRNILVIVLRILATLLTLNMLNYYKNNKNILTCWIVSWILFGYWRWNLLWNNNTCCLSYTANTMDADVLATLGASASAGMVLTPKPEYPVSSIRRVTITLGEAKSYPHHKICMFCSLRFFEIGHVTLII